MNKGPLSGIRVVEMSVFVAAPVTARLLADMGAEVIKIEAPSGDSWRPAGAGYLPRFKENEENPVFDIYNTGKKHICLNVKTPDGKEAFFKLLEEADVFITNLRPAALKRLGLSYDDIKDRFPSLVYAAVLGYGEKGPDADMPAYDTTAFWSRSGFLRDMAVKEDNFYMPVTAPSSVGDTATGYLLMGEICAALYRRTNTGTGDYVTSTLFHNGVFCMGTMAIITQEPFGRKYPAPRIDHGFTGNFECSDGEWIFFPLGIAANRPKYFEMIGHPEFLNDPRFNGPDSWKNRELLYNYFKDTILQHTAEYWVQYGHEQDLPITYMAHFSDVTKDPQAWANGYLEHVEFPNGNVDVMPASPIEMRSACIPPTRPAPKNGANTVEVLRMVGYSDEQIDAMLASGAAIKAE